jgi:hypothetical protein
MRLTIEISDELLIAVKRRAAELRQPLQKLVEDGLRKQLEGPRRRRAGKRKKIRWIVSPGGLPPGMNVSSRVDLHDWLWRQS